MPGKRITIVNRYFWPDTVLANDIAAWLAEVGYDVDVLTGRVSYNPEAKLGSRPPRETWKGVRIRRLWLPPETGRGITRHFASLLFILTSAVLLLVGRKRSAVWTTSIPPVLQPLLLRIVTALRGARLIYFVQDIYPEIALLMNMMRPGLASRLIGAADNWTMNRSDSVVTLSGDMAECLRSRGAPPARLKIINNFSANAPVTGDEAARPANAPCRFVFAGNIGRFQNLEQTLDLFAGMDPAVARLEMLGEGRLKQPLQEKVAAGSFSVVQFHPYRPSEEAFDFIRRCDVGVLSLVPGLYRYVYPSKTFTYLAAGLPLFCLIEEDSQLAREITARRLGVAVGWSAPRERRREALDYLISSHTELAQGLVERARDLFDREAARGRWLEAFAGVSPDGRE